MVKANVLDGRIVVPQRHVACTYEGQHPTHPRTANGEPARSGSMDRLGMQDACWRLAYIPLRSICIEIFIGVRTARQLSNQDDSEAISLTDRANGKSRSVGKTACAPVGQTPVGRYMDFAVGR